MASFGFWWSVDRWKKPKQGKDTTLVFQAMHLRCLELNKELQNLEGQLRMETPEASERSKARSELLQNALTDRRSQLQLFEIELHARKVQLWLNQLEGFVAEKLPQATCANSLELKKALHSIAAAGKQVLTASPTGEAASIPLLVRAKALVEEANAKIPDLFEEIRDMEVLHAVGDAQSRAKLDSKLETRAWLHWLHDALPELDNLRLALNAANLSSEQSGMKVLAQARVERETVPYTRARPSASSGTSSLLDGSIIQPTASITTTNN